MEVLSSLFVLSINVQGGVLVLFAFPLEFVFCKFVYRDWGSSFHWNSLSETKMLLFNTTSLCKEIKCLFISFCRCVLHFFESRESKLILENCFSRIQSWPGS